MKRPKIDDGMLLKVLFQELTAVDILGYDDLQSHLESYEKIWVDSAKNLGEPLDSSFSLGEKLWKDTQLANTLLEASLVFKTEQGKDREWAEQVVDEASLCITTDLENLLGSPLGDSPTVWLAISTITSGVDSPSEAAEESAAKVAAVEHELEGLLLGLQDFRTALSFRVTALEGTQTNVPDELEAKVKALEEDKETLQHRLDT